MSSSLGQHSPKHAASGPLKKYEGTMWQKPLPVSLNLLCSPAQAQQQTTFLSLPYSWVWSCDWGVANGREEEGTGATSSPGHTNLPYCSSMLRRLSADQNESPVWSWMKLHSCLSPGPWITEWNRHYTKKKNIITWNLPQLLLLYSYEWETNFCEEPLHVWVNFLHPSHPN